MARAASQKKERIARPWEKRLGSGDRRHPPKSRRTGLPVVASDLSGACDCVTEGKEGFIVAARDVDRTAKAIHWCYQHRDETRAMGRAARARIEGQFTLDHYNQRMIALYRGLVGAAA